MRLQNDTYIAPEYYAQFCCKGPSCKDNCCHDWPVAFDQEAYTQWEKVFDPEFRILKDRYVRLGVKPAGPEVFGCILQGEGGRCGFQDEDGGCRMIRLAGEEALCKTCKTYPRRKNEFIPGVKELSLSMSCEEAVRIGVIEQKELSFTEWSPEDNSPEMSLRTVGIGIQGSVAQPPAWGDLLRKVCLGLIQTRELSVKERLAAISLMLKRVDRAIAEKKEERIPAELLAFVQAVDAGQLSGFFQKLSYYPDAHALSFQLPAGHILAGRDGAFKDALREQLAGALSLDDRGRFTVEAPAGGNLLGLVQTKGDAILEKHPVWVENFIANYMFSSMFPFLYRSKGFSFEEHSFLLFHLYSLMRCLLALTSDELSDEERFTAAAVHAARFTQHGDYASDFKALTKTFKLEAPALLFYLIR